MSSVFPTERNLGLQLYYDPPPHALTRGQVSRTYCYDNGLQIAAFRYPLTGNYYWSTDQYLSTHKPCRTRMTCHPTLLGSRFADEAHSFWEQAYAASQLNRRSQSLFPG